MNHQDRISRSDSLFALHRRQPMMLGVFATNGTGSGGIHTVPSSYEVSWDHSLAIARLADEIGFELFMPVSRWRGFGGESNFAGDTYETLTYMAAIAAVTTRLMTIATIHLPMVHPVFAAKAVATIDHVSRGRSGINMVMGWYRQEMGMFGLAPHQIDERYSYATEWLEIVRALWRSYEPFDHDGAFFKLENLVSGPKPVQAAPPIVSAATSADGIAFAARHADLTFARSDDRDRLREHSRKMRELAADAGNKDVGVASLSLVVCRETEAEAKRYHQHLRDHADLVATRNLALSSGMNIDALPQDKQQTILRDMALSAGADALVGTPEQIAERIAGFHDAGIDALFLGFHDYLAELPFFAERVLPLLEERGLRGQRANRERAALSPAV
ncbi:LLM class flavin-dependent oxidoreductase [Sphingobium sp. WCS2017Hpa-17]|uniref:LLM class flavin-dependent oxidoreductase n=1 Tax=Sphingobium sp. WCS2017Hpa-17 TaxID=3073638 RepID=UPI00288C1BE3|nr:LLM class flavin-dependent oxidoreductase [Sphingobium sp. WCS2017Hpa-17]